MVTGVPSHTWHSSAQLLCSLLWELFRLREASLFAQQTSTTTTLYSSTETTTSFWPTKRLSSKLVHAQSRRRCESPAALVSGCTAPPPRPLGTHRLVPAVPAVSSRYRDFTHRAKEINFNDTLIMHNATQTTTLALSPLLACTSTWQVHDRPYACLVRRQTEARFLRRRIDPLRTTRRLQAQWMVAVPGLPVVESGRVAASSYIFEERKARLLQVCRYLLPGQPVSLNPKPYKP